MPVLFLHTPSLEGRRGGGMTLKYLCEYKQSRFPRHFGGKNVTKHSQMTVSDLHFKMHSFLYLDG